MMKIGILTFHNAHNYGAVMQAYALRSVLRRSGHEAAILNYRNQAIDAHYPKQLPFDRTEFSARRQTDWNKQYRKFSRFIDHVLLEDQTAALGIEDLERLKMDCFICGSDQIWEPWLTNGLDRVYFLDFNTKARKISYGASKAAPVFSNLEKEYFREKLLQFEAVSVREESLATALKRDCYVEAETVLDPTFLLDAEDYMAVAEPINVTQPFVLAYYLSEEEQLFNCAQKVAEQLKQPLVEIHFYRTERSSGWQVADCGPGEFLTYFRNASCVLTNSFHGVAFSIIFQRPFYAVYGKDSRKDSILNKLNLTERHIYSPQDIMCGDIGLQSVDASALLRREREKTLAFLKKSIGQ